MGDSFLPQASSGSVFSNRAALAASALSVMLVAFVVYMDRERSTGAAPSFRIANNPEEWSEVLCSPKIAETPIFQSKGFVFVTPVSPPRSARQPLPAPHELSKDWEWPAQALNISRYVNSGAPRILPAPRWSNMRADLSSGYVESLQADSYTSIAAALRKLHRAPRLPMLSQRVTFKLHSAQPGSARPTEALTPADLASARRMVLQQCTALQTPKVVQLSQAEVLSAVALSADAPVPLMCTQERAAAAAYLSAHWHPTALPSDWAAQLFEAIGGIRLPAGLVPHCMPAVASRLSEVDIPIFASALSPPQQPSPLQVLLGDNQYRPQELLRRMAQQHAAAGAASAPMLSPEASLWRHPITGRRTLVPQAGMREHHSIAVTPVWDNSTVAVQRSAWRSLLGSWQQLLSGADVAPALSPGDEHQPGGAGRFACGGAGGRRNFTATEEQCVAVALQTLTALRLGQSMTAPVAIAAHSIWGIPRGLSTLAQLFRGSDATMWAHDVVLHDAPRVPWRGMHTDTARHFQSAASMQAVLQAAASAKLNMLHWHISDAQSFPLALQFTDASGTVLQGAALRSAAVAAQGTTGSTLSARLVANREQAGALQGVFAAPFRASQVYTQQEVGDVVWLAATLGIRVLPELDSPAHTAAWAWAWESAAGSTNSAAAWGASLGKGSTGVDAAGGAGGGATPWRITPGLAPPAASGVWNSSCPECSLVAASPQLAGPQGAFPPNDPSINIVNRYALDPSSDAAYAVLGAVLQAAAAAFPDAYFHWGGDEVYAECWGQQAHITRWAKAHASELGLTPSEAEMNQQRLVQALVARHAWFVTRVLLQAGRLPVVWQGSFDMLPALHSALRKGTGSSADGVLLASVVSDDWTPGDKHQKGVSVHAPAGGMPPLAAGMPPFNLVQPWKCWGGEDKRSILRAARDDSTGGSTRNSCWYLDWPSSWPDIASHKLWSGFRGGLSGVRAASDLVAGNSIVRAEVSGAPLQSWEDLQARSGLWGGEVSLWSEGVVPSNQHCRLWPRAASVAQRLWTWAAFDAEERASRSAGDTLSTDFAQLLHFNQHLQQAVGIPSADLTSDSTSKDAQMHGSSAQCATVHRFSQPTDELLSEDERRPGTAVDPKAVHMSTIVWNAANGGEGDWPPPDKAKAADASGLLGRESQLGGRSCATLDAIRARDVAIAGIVEANGWEAAIQRDGARALKPSGSTERHNAYMRYAAEQGYTTHRQLQSRRPGVVSTPGLASRAARAGMAHSVMLQTPSGYDLALMAKWPISVLYWNTDDFERGVLVTAVRGHAIVLVHLHAHDSNARQLEAMRVNELVRELTSSGWPVAVMGDFNTLSPIDAALHRQHNLLKWLQQPAVPQRVRNKHVTTAAKAVQWAAEYRKRVSGYSGVVMTHVCLEVYAALAPSGDPVLDYRPMCELLAAGTMHDDCPPSDECASTEPTAYSLVEGFPASEIPPFRLDYVLVNPVLIDTSGEHSCTVLKDATTEWLSDHYPVTCSL